MTYLEEEEKWLTSLIPIFRHRVLRPAWSTEFQESQNYVKRSWREVGMGIKILVLKDGCSTKLDEKLKRTRGCENCRSLGLGYIMFRKSVSHFRRC